MPPFTFLRAGLIKITPPHLTNWLLVFCAIVLIANSSIAQSGQFYPNRIWVKVLNPQNAPINAQQIQTPNNIVNSILNNYNIVYFQKLLPWSSDSVLSTFYEITCNCNIDDLITDINQNLQGLIIHPKKVPLPDYMNYNPEDDLWQMTLLFPNNNNYLWHLIKIQASLAWSITQGNSNIKIAVIDNFIDKNHPDIQSKLLTNFDPLTGVPYSVPPTNNNLVPDHGTAVSGFAAAQTTPALQAQPIGADYASIGFNTSLLFYELGAAPLPGSPPNLQWGITGLQKAHHASYVKCADIINISWKNNFCGQDPLGYEEAIVRDILKNGTSIVVSAGNGIHTYSCPPQEQYPFPFSPTYQGCEDIILVTGTDEYDNHSPYTTSSNINTICSPDGGNVWSHNEEIDICAPSYYLLRIAPGSSFVNKCSGTSMSAPIVAGTVALMKSVNPCLTPHDIDVILSNPANADPINDANQFPGLLGAGRLNAFKAVQAAQNYIPSHVPLIDKNQINRNICKGQSTQLFALENECANLQWSHPQSLNNSTFANPIATPSQTTIYTLYATYPNGCIRQDTIVIYVHPLPDKPIITGINNTCDGLTINYHITNYNAQQTYIWSVNGGTVINQSGANATIQWNSSQGGTISVTTTNSNNCQNTSEVLMVHPCCIPSGLPPSTAYWNNTSASAINPASNPIVINGIFTVDQNLFLVGKQIHLGPDAKIEVLPNYVLLLNNNTILQAGCNYMWDGIYTEDPSAIIIVQNKCTIKDAKNAIVSKNGGYFSVSSSTLDKNYKHIVVENFNATHTGSIKQSYLQCTGGNSLIAPHTGKRTFKAIEISNVRQITIGDATSPANQNVFDNADYGVFGSMSHIIIKNNSFNNITTRSLYPNENAPQHFPLGTAIAFMGRPVFTAITIGSIIPALYVGGYNTDELNYFIQNEQNIHVKYRTEFTAVKNNMQNTALNAIRVDSAFVSNIHIHQNILQNSARGMFLYHNRGANVRITNNVLNSNNYAAGEGILCIENFAIAKPYTKQAKYRINNNNVSNYRRGISNYFLTAPRIENNSVQVPQLTINTQNRYGIEVIHNVRDTIISNTINPVGAPITSTKIGGVYVSNSTNSYIACNEVNRIGFGVQCAGNIMYPSKILNNRFRSLTVGFWLSNGGIVGQQGASGSPSDNRWIAFQNNSHHLRASGPITTDGSLSPFYVRTTGNFYPLNSSVLFSSPPSTPIDRISTTGPNTIHLCPAQVINFGANLRTAIAQDGISFSSNEERWMAKYGLYSEILEDPFLLPGDSVLQQFKDSMEQTNAAIIDSVKTILYDTAFGNNLAIITQAQNLTYSITPQVVTEQRMQNVLNLLIDKIINDDGSFNTSELSLLRGIASECPFIEGEAVYIARSLLFAYDTIGTEYISWCEGDLNPSNKMETEEEEYTYGSEMLIYAQLENSLSLYPNPTKGQLYVIYKGQNDLQYIEIFDLSGRKVITQDFVKDTKQQAFQFDISQLENGTYIAILRAGNDILHAEKIVILK